MPIRQLVADMRAAEQAELARLETGESVDADGASAMVQPVAAQQTVAEARETLVTGYAEHRASLSEKKKYRRAIKIDLKLPEASTALAGVPGVRSFPRARREGRRGGRHSTRMRAILRTRTSAQKKSSTYTVGLVVFWCCWKWLEVRERVTYIGLFFESAHQGAGGVHHYSPPYNLPALLSLSSLALGDGAIVSVSMRRSFHLAVVVRISASVSRYGLPGASGHAYHHHRLGAASRSPQAHSQQVVKARPNVVL